MKQTYIIDGLKAKLELDEVLSAMDCKKDSPVYESMKDEFDSIYDEAVSLLEPVGIFGFAELTELSKTEKYPSGTRVIYAVTSVGDKLVKLSNTAFDNGDYVRGMMYDVMADCALFSLEKRLMQILKEVCGEHNIGISERLEAPNDIPMHVQKEAWEMLELDKNFGIGITDGYMYNPIKTTCQVFIVSEDTAKFKACHDCRKCPNIGCKFRNIPKTEVKVHIGSNTQSVFLNENETLMDALIREKIYISAVCGGSGRCGKCKVRVTDGTASVSAEDRRFFSDSELDDGLRLSCTLRPETDIEIELNFDNDNSFEVVSEYQSAEKKCENTADADGEYEIAIDIGTTTIVFQLIDKNDGSIYGSTSRINRQRSYGADVVSRIQASAGGKGAELKESIRTDLKEGILLMCSECGVSTQKILRIAISANTTMCHLLMGYDCTSLGQYPFTPVNIDFIYGSAEDILGLNLSAEVVILPSISTYVGGDIVSGLYACGFDSTDDVCLLIDLGTNGEMAVGNRYRILTTSTAAGPAFEGGNISCGTGSVEGAVCSAVLNGAEVQLKTIKDKPPVGICGTGVVEITAELIKEGFVDETGLLDDEYFDSGFKIAESSDGESIVFTQKDIRELQLAKAAIRAGAETLILRYGISKDQISKVYIAGGFGYKLDIKKAAAIGMIDGSLADCVKAVGNTSLAGAVKYLKNDNAGEIIQGIVDVSEEIALSTDEAFNELYMESMMFAEE